MKSCLGIEEVMSGPQEVKHQAAWRVGVQVGLKREDGLKVWKVWKGSRPSLPSTQCAVELWAIVNVHVHSPRNRQVQMSLQLMSCFIFVRWSWGCS